MTLKKVWLTEHENLSSLSMESEDPSQPHTRIIFHESFHPANPTPEHPLRHVLVISCLTDEDLCKLHKAIGRHIGMI